METLTPQSYPPFLKEWFSSRLLDEQKLIDQNVTWDENKNVIRIPIFNSDGMRMFCKYRRDPRIDTGPKYQYDFGAGAALYCSQELKKAKEVLICEGEFDALFAHSHGFNAVSSTGGSGTFLPEWGELFVGKDVYIVYDNDAAGARGAIKVQQIIPWAKIVLLPVSSGVKDLTDYGRKIHASGSSVSEAIQNKMKEARTYRCDPIEIADDATMAAKKRAISDYTSRIVQTREMRGEASRVGNGDTTFYDTLMAYYEGFIDDVRRSMKKKATKTFTDTGRVDAAKAVPIPNFVKFNRQAMAKCVFHEDSTASMHYIRGSNKVHCFGCGKTADAIEVTMAIDNCDFTTALNKLV